MKKNKITKYVRIIVMFPNLQVRNTEQTTYSILIYLFSTFRVNYIIIIPFSPAKLR